MKFLSFRHAGRDSYGAVQGAGDTAGIINLGARHPGVPDLRAALRQQQLCKLGLEAARSAIDFFASDIEFLPTIPNPEKIICIGVNYANRNAEYRDGSDLPQYPSVFMRTRESLAGHGQALLRPPESEQLDYEGEIVLVVGKEGRRIPREKASQYIAGLTIMNEGSVRDWLRHSKFNVTQGKNFEHSGALGPWLVSSDELDPMGELHLQTRVNGEVRQDDSTASLMFPFDYLISYVSTFYRLKPGDIIATGTPNGAGARFNPPRYLRHGDVVEVSVEGIGVLRNTVTDEFE
jgi:2-keto-4-pentenoate hydratase/2-oxohepta-3-ene-1,7-dioic acid hydratase in catechol pathway